MTKNLLLNDIIESLGGVGETAALLSGHTGEDISYDRVYQWRRSGRVPGWAIVPLCIVAKRQLSKADIAALTGPVRKRVPKASAMMQAACA